MKRYRILKFLSILFIILFSVAGCSKITPVAPVSKIGSNDREMVYTTTDIPTTLSPSSYIKTREEDIIASLFEGLIEVTENGVIAPALAEGWNVSDDGIKYSFLIRKDIYWSDGSKITAKDFEKYFEYLLSKDNNNYTSNELYSIYGVEKYRNGEGTFKDVGIIAKDERHLNINLNRKDPDFLKKLTKPEYRLRNPEDELANYINSYRNIRYSGAYIISKIDNNDSISLTKNKEYSLKFSGAKNIKIVKSKDNIKDFARLSTNKVDLAYNPPYTVFEESSLRSNTYNFESSRLEYMVFNSTKGLSQYLDFRKGIYIALSMSIMESYLPKNDFATVDIRPITKAEVEESVFYKKENKQVYSEEIKNKNFEMSSKYLKEIPNLTKDNLRIIAKDSFENKKLAEFIKEELEKYKINVSYKFYNKDELEEALKAGNFNIFLGEVNLEEENINDTIKSIERYYRDFDYSIFSLYNENNLWSKSDNLKNVYIDANGNIILKKMLYIG